MKKRILAVIMAVCVSMTALPADVRAAEDGAVQTESTQAMETSSAEEAAVTEEASETENDETETSSESETTETGESSETETGVMETEETAETETGAVETEEPAETETTKTESTETETAETETAETETEEPAETETIETESTETETETETVQAAEMNYMMVESPYVETPGTQNVVLSLGTGNEQLSDIVLNYQNLATGKTYQVKAAGTEEDMIRFTMDFSENGQAGEYQITSVQFTQEKTKQEILLSDLGMDVRFGVNEQAETNPDQVLYDEDAYADVDADVVTMSEDGEIVSENTVENVLEQGISKAVIGSMDHLKGANSSVTVVLDPGHDGTHAGASAFGVQEADLTLKIATYCKEELSTYNGITVYMTRESASCPAGGGDNTACLDARANLAKCLLYAINGGVDEKLKTQVGPEYKPITSEYLDYDEVMQKYDQMMDWLAHLYVGTLNMIHYMHDKYYYEAAEMALIDTKVERSFATGIAGFSHVVDSLSAIKYAKVKAIRDEDGITTDFQVEGDFPRYGNDDDRADEIARNLLSTFMDKLKHIHTYRDSKPTTSILTITSNVVYGKATGALPDGRKAGEPLAPGANPSYGAEQNGLLASLNSVAKLDYEDALDGISNTQTINPEALGHSDEERTDNLVHVLDGYFNQGAHHLNVNVFGKEKLIDAMEHPEKEEYANFTIRVSGYAVKFIDLTREQQLDVIARTCHDRM